MPGRQDSRSRATALLPVLLLCLFARALVPAGWMPSFTPHGIALMPCTGMAATTGVHSMHHAAGHDHSDKGKHDVGGQPCSFAAAAVNLPAPTLIAALSTVAETGAHFIAPPAVSIGKGLAAPPPPSTGPPITA